MPMATRIDPQTSLIVFILTHSLTFGRDERTHMPANIADRSAYQSESILAEGVTLSNDTWSTDINCNQLVLGPSGSGKTRNFLKPNLLQANSSFLVLDTKALLYKEVGPVLERLGYDVQMINFAKVSGTVGYDPLDHIARNPMTGAPSQRDILSVASAICPEESSKEPFWDHAAANYLASMIAAVVETFPTEEQTFDNVIALFEEFSVEEDRLKEYFASLQETNPDSFALKLYRRASCTQGAERMHASIMGIISEKLMCLGFEEAVALFRNHRRVDFNRMGHQKVALFVSISDTEYALTPLTSLFVSQAIQSLVREADACPGGRLPMPVRLFLDDFSNLVIPNFQKILSVTRSRELWCTILCQSVAQLQELYGREGAEGILGNCDTQLVLAFQDNATAEAYANRANKTPASLLATPANTSWLFVRGWKPMMVRKYDLTTHENFLETAEASSETNEPSEEWRPMR